MALPPIIPDLPPAPSRSDGPAGFTPKADAMVAALRPMVTAQNQQASWMNDTATQVAIDAASAAADADRAEAVDTELQGYVDDATAQVALAATYANNAAASAAAAESAQGSIGNLALLHAVALSF